MKGTAFAILAMFASTDGNGGRAGRLVSKSSSLSLVSTVSVEAVLLKSCNDEKL